MCLLLLLGHRSFHRQSSWIPGHTHECRECITLPKFVSCAPPKRASEFTPDCRTCDDLITSVRATQGRSRGQRGSSFAISPRTILKSTASPTCAGGLSHSLPLRRAHALRPSSRFTKRLSTYAACLTNHGKTMLLLSTLWPSFSCNTHVSSREALDPSRNILDQHLELFSTIVLSDRLSRTASTSAWMAGSFSALINTSLRPLVSKYASTQSTAQGSGPFAKQGSLYQHQDRGQAHVRVTSEEPMILGYKWY